MAFSDCDRNLLFGLLALRSDFISSEQLIAAVTVWVADKSQPLDQVLRAQRALAEHQCQALAEFVGVHVKKHGNDPGKSLAALSNTDFSSIRHQLLRCGDPDLEESLSKVAASTDSRFRIKKFHAKGAVGEVFVAHDLELDRDVALKKMNDRHAMDPVQVSRFELESRLTGRLEHPGIVPVYGLGEYDDGRPYYAMRFISGKTLDDAIKDFHKVAPDYASMDFYKILGRFIDVCNAIEYAHKQGVIHRDLKPTNVLLGDFGETLVVDWGLAKVHQSSLDSTVVSPESQAAKTMTGVAMGTAAYMPPEQAEGRWNDLSWTSDVYSLGATLYHVLTGKPAFEGEVVPILKNVVKGQFVAPHEVESRVPKALEAVCLKAMANDPQSRYRSPRELADEVERYLNDEPVSVYREPISSRMRRWLRKYPRRFAALATTMLVGVACALIIAAIIYGAKEELQQAFERETRAKEQAEKDKAQAITAKAQAEKVSEEKQAALLAARDEKRKAEQAQTDANRHRTRAELQLYAARIASVQARLKDNDLGSAATQLTECPEKSRGWEYRMLHQALSRRMKTFTEHNDSALCVDVSSDGRRIVAAYRNKKLKVWDTQNRKEWITLKGHDGPVRSVAFSDDGRRIVSGSEDSTVRIWDAEDGHEIATLRGHTREVVSVAFSPDARRIASGSDDNNLKLWDAETFEEIRTFVRGEDTGSIFCLAFSPPDGRQLVSGSWQAGDNFQDGLTIWDVETGDKVRGLGVLKEGSGPPREVRDTVDVKSVAFSPDGRRIVSAEVGPAHQAVKVWMADTPNDVAVLTVIPPSEVNSICYANDGQSIVSGDANAALILWNAKTGEEEFTLRGHTGAVNSVVFSQNGQLIVSGGSDGAVKVWDAHPGQHDFLLLEGHEDEVGCVAFSPDGRRIVSGSHDETLRIWDTDTQEATCLFKGHTGTIAGAAFLPDGRQIASVELYGKLKLWSAESGDETIVLKEQPENVTCVAASPADPPQIVAGELFGKLKVWSAITGEPEFILDGHKDEVTCAAFSPDGGLIVSGSKDKTLKIWSTKDRNEICILEGHADSIYGVAFSPDGQRIVSASGDKTLKVWNVKNAELVLTLNGHTDTVYSAVFSNDGKRIISGSADNMVKIWDTATAVELLTMKHYTPARCVAFSPVGRRMVVGWGDKSLKVWGAEPEPRLEPSK